MLSTVAACALIAASLLPAAAPAVVSTSRPDDQIVCQRFAEPGSMIRKRKICLTRAEWGRLSEEAQRNTDRLQLHNLGGAEGCRPGSPGC